MANKKDKDVVATSTNYTDSFLNQIELGNIKLTSPANFESMDELIKKAIALLKDKSVRSYLETLKNQKVNNQNYFG